LLQRTLNLGILAHVDAGKTTLTERLLYAAGVIDEIGSVDHGTTQTDSLALERQRGITIKSAVVSFAIDDITVNLIDTPGHPDFVAEVERVLNVLDGAVLVVSAVEGVQAQTRVLMRALERLRLPTLIFVNKIDRGGAGCERVLGEIGARLSPATIAMGSAHGEGTGAAIYRSYVEADATYASRLVDLLSAHDDALLAAYLDDETSVSFRRLREELAVQSQRALVHPVFFGSAITGAGVDPLVAGIAELLPATEGDAGGSVSGSVFKVERGPAGEKVAYARILSGTIRVRDRLAESKMTAIRVFDHGSAVPSTSVGAGQIGKLWGLGDVQIGDALGERAARAAAVRPFARPTLESVVVPSRPADKALLHSALAQLAEQDPLINLRQDDGRQELSVSLYGEVQKEVIQATLADDFGLEVAFRETTMIHVERPVGIGEAVAQLGDSDNPFLATIGLRVEPAPIDSGVEFRLAVGVRSVPLYVYKSVDEFVESVEEYVRSALRQGPHGWQVIDCKVTMTASGYASPVSGAGDFRKLTPLVLSNALRRAGTEVCEPMHRVSLEIPADTIGTVLSVLARLDAVAQAPTMQSASCAVDALLPAARVHDLERQLPALTRGEGVVESTFDQYRPVIAAPRSSASNTK
jgi:ribosomal protection tetracycline resistance protein